MVTKKDKNIFTVFEHQAVWTDRGDNKLTPKELKALQNFYKEKDFPYYTLIYNGVRFCEYVGVIQVGNLKIEVLPKADNNGEDHWRNLLINMLKAVGLFKVNAPTNSNLGLKSNSILDLYFELFVKETEALLQKGLIKKYRKNESNITSLKGNIHFAKQISKNLVHKELFYTKHSVYDREHPLNCVLYKTICLLSKINTNQYLQSKICNQMLNFPELPNIKTDENFFNKIEYNRKTEPHKNAIEIAKLILLNYHPDVNRGSNDVLALMFDMNSLWEKFVFISLKKNQPIDFQIRPQAHKYFWQKDEGRAKKMIPDIVIEKANNEIVVLDTKWKNIGTSNPSDADLRQMYAYSKYHGNAKTALVYPGLKHQFINGLFFNEDENNLQAKNACGILTIETEKNVKDWQALIANNIFGLVCN